MHVFDWSISLYRKTIKRSRAAHVATHWLMKHIVIPGLEALRRFKTMPDDPFWFRLELLTNRHEAESIQLVDRLLKPGMIMLDVGAHVGYYARRAARLVGEEGQVFAFEPHPRTFGVLSRNVSRYSNVTPIQVALSDEEGTAELYDYLMMSASGSLHYDESLLELQKAHLTDFDIAPRISEGFPTQKYTVQTITVDHYLAEQGIQSVDLVKMDIEGAEIGALRGMKATIAGSPQIKLIMEYNPKALKAFEYKPQEALREVLSLGFATIQVIEPDGSLTDLTNDPAALDELTERLMENMGVVNLLLAK
ncbi:MAG: FkbM family methyltransferase [Anaerolineae bacterium]|nr:FkbM family methyltransferase [Anaerolineae bacterium]